MVGDLVLLFGETPARVDAIGDIEVYVYEEKRGEEWHVGYEHIKPHRGDANNPYDMGVSEAQDYAINRGFGIPFNDGEVFVDSRYITQTVGNILRWADEHPKEQKPAEWSEEDIKRIVTDRERRTAMTRGEKYMFREGVAETIQYFKFRPHWKPSEEQMKRLADAVESWRGGIGYNELKSLYNDLLKLK